MTLDEEKLKIAFKENPESTKQFFFGFNGIGHDIDKSLRESLEMKGLSENALKVLKSK